MERKENGVETLHEGGKSTPVLRTRRLLLNRFAQEDAEAMWEGWANSGEVTKWMFFEPGMTLEECRDYMRGLQKRYEEDESFHQWAIRLEGSLVGSSGLFVEERNQCGTVAYLIAEPWWGKGLMTEALTEILRFGFRELGLHRIEAAHFVENGASGRVMEKAGMRREAVLREKYAKYGTYHDAVMYAALSGEWKL